MCWSVRTFCWTLVFCNAAWFFLGSRVHAVFCIHLWSWVCETYNHTELAQSSVLYISSVQHQSSINQSVSQSVSQWVYCITRKCFWQEGQQVFKVWLCFFLYSFPVKLGQIALCLEHVPSIYKDGREVLGPQGTLWTLAVTWNTMKCDKWICTECMTALWLCVASRMEGGSGCRYSVHLPSPDPGVGVLEPKLCDRVIWTSSLCSRGFTCIMVTVCVWEHDLNLQTLIEFSLYPVKWTS